MSSSMSSIYDHGDALEELNQNLPLSKKLQSIHRALRERMPGIDRVAIALYDPKTDVLRTFVYSGDTNPLPHYESLLKEAPSLLEILQHRRPRVVNDLSIFRQGEHAHTQRIAESGFSSSYTIPMYLNGIFFGFVFFNSYEANAFPSQDLGQLDLYGHLISLLMINELSTVRTLAAAVQGVRDITAYRDFETGAHLDRMSHYARLIAHGVADKFGLSDEAIESIFHFASLHDIGKIGIPDGVLNKAGPLSPEEYEVMKTHVSKGREMIDTMVRDFDLGSVHDIDVLRNIAELHHEAIDGSGYLHGLKGDEIPLESRIIAVADVFDALTSKRCYKDAWTIPEAFAMMERLAGITLDRDCVDALVKNLDKVVEIQHRFAEESKDPASPRCSPAD